MKTVELTRGAMKQLARVDKQQAGRILIALERFADSGVGDVKKLKGREQDAWRLRVGNYRVIFTEETRATEQGDFISVVDVVLVEAIGHRREIYE